MLKVATTSGHSLLARHPDTSRGAAKKDSKRDYTTNVTHLARNSFISQETKPGTDETFPSIFRGSQTGDGRVAGQKRRKGVSNLRHKKQSFRETPVV